jgi:anaerobic selenocysteine-containing dehydrogenase
VLPCTSPLERPDLPFIFPLMLGLQAKPYLQATQRVVRPEGEVRDEATIYVDLARAADAPMFGSRLFQRVLEIARNRHSKKHPDEQPAVPQEAFLSVLLGLCGQQSFDALLRQPHGVMGEPHRDNDFLSKRIVTDDRKLHLVTPRLLAQSEKLEADFVREKTNARRLKLITKRAVTTHNSWTHNIADFVAGDRDTNYLYMHPDDAHAAGLHDDDLADVSTDTARVRVPVHILADLMPGTVALPHGWGHQHAPGLSIASKTRGVNVNLLAADGPERLERVSGMAHLTGFVVSVTRAAGPQDPHDWSGIAPV